jgi:hypothetical protein|tara:strand:+ start:111 stop:443 length:333 start_codon:yes stop_codon:yes gene_type:complete
MSTYYVYHLEPLDSYLGGVVDQNMFDNDLTPTQKAPKADLLAVLDLHCSTVVTEPMDSGETYSLSVAEDPDDELDLCVYRMYQDSDNCVIVFLHPINPYAGNQQVWTYDV